MKPDQEKLVVLLSPEMKERLRTIAGERGRPVAETVRGILADYIQHGAARDDRIKLLEAKVAATEQAANRAIDMIEEVMEKAFNPDKMEQLYDEGYRSGTRSMILDTYILVREQFGEEAARKLLDGWKAKEIGKKGAAESE